MEKHITIICGHFGSGKTELALDLALQAKPSFERVFLCDMDVINPYFRSRDYETHLSERGIELIAPKGELSKADLPIITKEVRNVIEDEEAKVIIDLGGDKDGAISIGQFAQQINEKDYEMIFVGNINRPYVSTVEGMIETIKGIEYSSRLKITNIVNNTHLIDEYIPPEIVLKGEEVCIECAKELQIPFLFSFISEQLWNSWLERGEKLAFQNVVRFDRKLLTPWNL